jgi:hypothetical protein
MYSVDASRRYDWSITSFLATQKIGRLFLYQTVVLNRGHFGDNHYIRRRVTYHDAQIPPEETDIVDKVKHLYGISSDSTLPPESQAAIHAWKAAARHAHEALEPNQ